MWSTVFSTVVLNLDNIVSPVFGSISAVSIKLGSASFFTKSLTADVWSVKLDSPRVVGAVVFGVQVVQFIDPVAGVAGFLMRAGSIKLIVFLTGLAVVSTDEAEDSVPVAGFVLLTDPEFLMCIVSAKLGVFMGVVPVVPTASVARSAAVPVDVGSDRFVEPEILMRPASPKIGFLMGFVPVLAAPVDGSATDEPPVLFIVVPEVVPTAPAAVPVVLQDVQGVPVDAAGSD